jgi:hypothetical protein
MVNEMGDWEDIVLINLKKEHKWHNSRLPGSNEQCSHNQDNLITVRAFLVASLNFTHQSS